MKEINGSPEAGSIDRIRETLKELTETKKLVKYKIADYLGLEESQRSSFYKFIKGDPYPKNWKGAAGKMLEKLKKLEENPDLLEEKEAGAENDTTGYGIAPASPFVWIPFEMKGLVVDYNGTKPHLSIIQMGKKKGIIADRNNSPYDADGEIYVNHIGTATNIEPGTRIAIKRINKEDWQTDCYYLIIDVSDQKSIRELLPGDDKKTVRYISTSAPDGPHKTLELKRIAAMFSIVDGNCIPIPKRNQTFTSYAQQQGSPSPSEMPLIK